MSEKSNFTGILTSIFIVVLIFGLIIPHIDIKALNDQFKNYQVIIALVSALIVSFWGFYSYLNLNFKKEEKTSIQVQNEHLDQLTKINEHLIESQKKDVEQDVKINENSNEITKIKIKLGEQEKELQARNQRRTTKK